MSVDRVIHSVRLIDPSPSVAAADGAVTDDAWIAVDAGTVAAIGVGGSWRELAPRAAHDGGGRYLSPGFIDIHGHGGGGSAFDHGPDAIATARALHRAHGTTRAVISLMTAPLPDLVARTAMVADLAAADPAILGSHLEGPFLAASHKGAHDPALLRDPDPSTVDALLEAGRGTVRQVTMAPELPGGAEAMRRILGAGAAVAVGHTDADLDTARRAFDAGATILTHAFNAMNGIHHRAPGPMMAAIDDERVTLELIADGTHVHPSVLRLAIEAAPGRIALITDAMAAAGAADGPYTLGDLDVVVSGGVAHLAGGDTIAGSTLTQDAAIRRVVRECGMPLPAAIAAATVVPARAVGRLDLGRLEPGSPADAVLLSDSLEVQAVWVDGEPVQR